MKLLQKILALLNRDKIKKAVLWAIRVTNDIKALADNKTLAEAVLLTPTMKDDVILSAAQAILATWLKGLNWADKKLSEFDPDSKAIVLAAIASKLATMYDPSVTIQQAGAGVPVAYDEWIVK